MKYNTGCTKNMQHRDFQLKSIPEVRFYFEHKYIDGHGGGIVTPVDQLKVSNYQF